MDNNGSKKQAALKLQLCTRQINRLIKGYQEYGKSFFVHGNRGYKPINAIPEETKKNIIFCIVQSIMMRISHTYGIS